MGTYANYPTGYFFNVDSDRQFWLQNGQSIKNLVELVNILKDLDENIFNFHVNSQKNDFANWIKEIIDREFGEKLLVLKDKNEIINAIEKRLEKISKKDEEPNLKYPTLNKIPVSDEEQIETPKPTSFDSKLNEVIQREEEIEARERIIQNLEERIERKLHTSKEKRLFSKEFVEGLLIGILILLICGLVYIKFFMPY